MRWTTVTSHPCTCSPRAASSPSRPPPITTALVPGRQRSSRARVSSRLRKTKTPSFFTSSIEGMSGTLPVASRSLKKRSHAAIVTGYGFGMRIDADDADSEAEIDAMLLVPIEAVEDDIVARFFSRQNRREQNAVVVNVCLVAEDRDFKFRRVAQNLLHAGDSRHSVSYDYQLCHELASSESAFFRRMAVPGFSFGEALN